MNLRTVLIASTLFAAATVTLAQSNPPLAPLPEAVTNAQKILLGNAGETDNDDCLRAYNDFYAGLKADRRFQLVLDPASADLVLELHYELRPGEGDRGPHPVVDTAFARQFRLVLLEPRTHTVLWSLTEVENNALLQSNRNKNLDAAVAQLLIDFKQVNQNNYSAPMPSSGKKIRLSDEGTK